MGDMELDFPMALLLWASGEGVHDRTNHLLHETGGRKEKADLTIFFKHTYL